MKPAPKKLGGDGVSFPRLYDGYGLRPNHHAIYFVVARDREFRSRIAYLKIGMSSDPIARVVQLQSSSPLPFVHAWYIQVPAHATRKIETELHELLSAQCSRGEWFRVTVRARKDRQAVKLKIAAYFISKGIIPHRVYGIDVPGAVAAFAAMGFAKKKAHRDVPIGEAIRNGWHKQ